MSLTARRSVPALAITLAALSAFFAGCQSTYYAAAEKVGYEKRDILVDRVESARNSQEDARTEISDALEEYRKVVAFDGGDLEAHYRSLSSKLKDSEKAAAAVSEHIRDVEHVADALFSEWKDELADYSSADLRARSARQLGETRARYDQMMAAMKHAESKLDPALAPLRDQVLFLKHNLNARAIAGLRTEVAAVDARVNDLIRELDRAIAEADRFIAGLEQASP